MKILNTVLCLFVFLLLASCSQIEDDFEHPNSLNGQVEFRDLNTPPVCEPGPFYDAIPFPTDLFGNNHLAHLGDQGWEGPFEVAMECIPVAAPCSNCAVITTKLVNKNKNLMVFGILKGPIVMTSAEQKALAKSIIAAANGQRPGCQDALMIPIRYNVFVERFIPGENTNIYHYKIHAEAQYQPFVPCNIHDGDPGFSDDYPEPDPDPDGLIFSWKN